VLEKGTIEEVIRLFKANHQYSAQAVAFIIHPENMQKKTDSKTIGVLAMRKLELNTTTSIR